MKRAIVQTLRHTGIRIEELLELTQLSIRQYRRPNGEVFALRDGPFEGGSRTRHPDVRRPLPRPRRRDSPAHAGRPHGPAGDLLRRWGEPGTEASGPTAVVVLFICVPINEPLHFFVHAPAEWDFLRARSR